MGNEINERIRYYRELKKLSQEALGEAVGLAGNAFSKREREGNFKVEEIIDIAKFLDIDPDLIIYGEEKKVEYEMTPAIPKPVVFSDPSKDNPFAPPQEPEILFGYKFDDMTLSVVEKQIIDCYRGLSEKNQQDFLEMLNKYK